MKFKEAFRGGDTHAVTALVAVRIEMLGNSVLSSTTSVTALVAVRIEMVDVLASWKNDISHRPCGGED